MRRAVLDPARWGRPARVFASPVGVVALALPLAAVAMLAALGWLDRAGVATSVTVRGFGLAALASVAATGARAVLEKRWATALASGALLAAAAHVALAYGRGYDARFDLGEGEDGAATRTTFAGPFARVPRVGLVKLPDAVPGAAELRIGGAVASVPIGREVEVARARVTVEAIHAAPGFRVARASGALEAEGAMKIVPGERNYFEVAVLPHRLYVTVPDAPAAGGKTPETLGVEVFRGKVRLVREERLPLRKPVSFEGLTIVFDDGARWARVRVRSETRNGLLALAGALAVAAAWLAFARRRGAP